MKSELCQNSIAGIINADFADILKYSIPQSKDKCGYLIWLSDTENKYVYEKNENLPIRFLTQREAIDVIIKLNRKLPIYILTEPSESEKTNIAQLDEYANGQLSEID